MQRQLIHSLENNRILYEGVFETFKDCVEAALNEKVDLSGANFKNKNLSFINLDAVEITDASFEEANLTGANISECTIHRTSFLNATVHGVCFAESKIIACDFQGCFFGGTNIDGASFERCDFDTLSSLNMNFTVANDIQECTFHDSPNKQTIFSLPPIKITGLDYPIVIFDETVKIGPLLIAFQDIDRFQYHPNVRLIPGSGRVYNFTTKNKKLIQEIIEQRALDQRVIPKMMKGHARA